ncbi:MAG: hypothetical protein JWN36_42 [Microbacteriaceae bacterium]|nr:hypothetical protein [Microbacteriaceae bacterium]
MGAFLREIDPERVARQRRLAREVRRVHFIVLAVTSAVLCLLFALRIAVDGLSPWGILEAIAVVLLAVSIFLAIRLPGSPR